MSTINFVSNQKLWQQNNAQIGKYKNTMRKRQLTLYGHLKREKVNKTCKTQLNYVVE